MIAVLIVLLNSLCYGYCIEVHAGCGLRGGGYGWQRWVYWGFMVGANGLIMGPLVGYWG